MRTIFFPTVIRFPGRFLSKAQTPLFDSVVLMLLTI
jgi:hypothetical protein